MQKGVESAGKFVVSGRDASELLEAIEESLDEVSCLVAMPVALRWVLQLLCGGMIASAPEASMMSTKASLS